jgi:hypothetical protein
VKVSLSADELRLAAEAGVERRLRALGKGRRGAHGFDRDYEAWSIDIEGVAAEWACAKCLGVDYTPVVGELDTEMGDVAPGVQVRSTRYETGHLLLHESDLPDHYFLLIVGLAPDFRIAGWTTPAESRKPEFWKVFKNRGAYWIPQAELRPVEELACLLLTT